MDVVTRAQHAQPRSRALRVAIPIGLIVTAVGALWAITELLPGATESAPPVPLVVQEVPAVESVAVPAADPCADPDVIAALAASHDDGVIAAFGGGASFRAAVTAGNAPCISLTDPARIWVVVNKALPLDPVEYVPPALASIPLQTTTGSSQVRPEVAAALEALGQAADAGRLGANNGYRSFGLQLATYNGHVRSSGQDRADDVSARAGHSEHQTGLAVDVVACGDRCGSIDGFPSSSQSEWVAANAWQYGFVVRYESDATAETGYQAEPWHLRYIGLELARAYHEGGYHSLEQFFELPDAPGYLD